jgi:hypothetical protein
LQAHPAPYRSVTGKYSLGENSRDVKVTTLPSSAEDKNTWRCTFTPSYIGYEVALGQVISQYFGFPCQFSFHELLRPRGWSLNPGRVKNFLSSKLSRPALRSTQPPIQWVPGVKRPGREVDHSPPTSAEVKKMWIYTSTPRLHGVVLN